MWCVLIVLIVLTSPLQHKSGDGGLSASEPATEPVSLCVVVAKGTLDMTSQSEWTTLGVTYGSIYADLQFYDCECGMPVSAKVRRFSMGKLVAPCLTLR